MKDWGDGSVVPHLGEDPLAVVRKRVVCALDRQLLYRVDQQVLTDLLFEVLRPRRTKESETRSVFPYPKEYAKSTASLESKFHHGDQRAARRNFGSSSEDRVLRLEPKWLRLVVRETPP